MHSFALPFLTAGGEDVTVASRVDENLRSDGAAARLVLDDERIDSVSVKHWLADPALVENTDAGLAQQVVSCEDEGRWLEGHGVTDTMRAAAPDKTPSAVLLDECWIRVVPVLRRRVVGVVHAMSCGR